MSRNRILALTELTFQQGNKVRYLVLHVVASAMRQRRGQWEREEWGRELATLMGRSRRTI